MIDGGDRIPQTNIPYLVVCSVVALWLLFLLIYYRIQYYDSPPIVAILALLLFNSLVQILFEIPGYLEGIVNSVCLISITGTTFFRLAQYYWLIFVTRLVYRQKLQPGKYIDLTKYVSKNIIFTYIPSIVVALIVLIVANIDQTQSQINCWRIINQTAVIDYIIYLSCFVLPNFIALLLIIFYFIAYLRIKKNGPSSICVFFPITAFPFMTYYLVLKLMTFFGQWDISNLLDVPLVGQPFCHGVIFAMVLRNLSKGKRPTSSDLTIAQQSSLSESMNPRQSEQVH